MLYSAIIYTLAEKAELGDTEVWQVTQAVRLKGRRKNPLTVGPVDGGNGS